MGNTRDSVEHRVSCGTYERLLKSKKPWRIHDTLWNIWDSGEHMYCKSVSYWGPRGTDETQWNIEDPGRREILWNSEYPEYTCDSVEHRGPWRTHERLWNIRDPEEHTALCRTQGTLGNT